MKRDEIYSYDKLNRVLQSLRGTIVSGSISSPAETEKWALDPLGNQANWTTCAAARCADILTPCTA